MEWDYTDSASTNEHETRSTLHELIKQEACGFFFVVVVVAVVVAIVLCIPLRFINAKWISKY